ncbi:hypothetical protein GCM10023149_16090 [Mucilaginibacter gynuensis]|uniref:histidine kinase n=2 Tax=Mucilaginibacter gynuensis TaxID=1302236 RepID=A0ABP8G5Z7_9SPHI
MITIIILVSLVIFSLIKWSRSARRELQDRYWEIKRLKYNLRAYKRELDDRYKEREWLIGEINHRVKNNLQIISSLLSQQLAHITDKHATESIKTTQQRLHAIALAYRRTYRAEQLTKVDIHQYVNDLFSYLRDEFRLADSPTLKNDTGAIFAELEVAVPMGLIIYEAVSNAIKFAFSDTVTGEVKVSITRLAGDKLELVISDNGIGFPGDTGSSQTNGLGTSLITGLGRQLGGQFEIYNNNGAILRLLFEFKD